MKTNLGNHAEATQPKSKLTRASEISQILSIPLWVLAIGIACMALRVAMQKPPLPAMPSFQPSFEVLIAWLGIIVSLIGLAISASLWIGFMRLAQLENGQEKSKKAVGELAESIESKIVGLETKSAAEERVRALNASILGTVDSMLEHRIPGAIKLLTFRLEHRIANLELADGGEIGKMARVREELDRVERKARDQETYPVIQDDGGARQWTRKEIDELPETQQRRLFERHPDLGEWWLGKPDC